jgi:hypothetical protein
MLFEFWSLQVTTEDVGLYPREWRMALQLADEHGFGVPDGWSKTPPTEVPEEQARALGAALKRALPELPSEEHRQDVGLTRTSYSHRARGTHKPARRTRWPTSEAPIGGGSQASLDFARRGPLSSGCYLGSRAVKVMCRASTRETILHGQCSEGVEG